MKLYYTPGACSLSPHIVLREAGFTFDLEKVDHSTKKTEKGNDFNGINEKSAVPVLELDNGERLTEGVAIVQYLADLKPAAKLAPQNGTFERARLHEILNYITSEIHKAYTPLFHPEYGEAATVAYTKKLKTAFDYIARKLEGKQYLFGDTFSVADAYLFTVLNWHQFVKLDLSPWPALVAFQARVAARPAVKDAMRAEGLLGAKAA